MDSCGFSGGYYTQVCKNNQRIRPVDLHFETVEGDGMNMIDSYTQFQAELLRSTGGKRKIGLNRKREEEFRLNNLIGSQKDGIYEKYAVGGMGDLTKPMPSENYGKLPAIYEYKDAPY